MLARRYDTLHYTRAIAILFPDAAIDQGDFDATSMITSRARCRAAGRVSPVATARVR